MTEMERSGIEVVPCKFSNENVRLPSPKGSGRTHQGENMKNKTLRNTTWMTASSLLSAVMVLSPLATTPVYAATSNSDKEKSTSSSAQEIASYLVDNDQSEIFVRTTSEESTGEFPERFDLRDQGVVTPVKCQNPWGTCWGFSAVAAAETSILSSLGKTYEETGLDLSEHHLAWFANTYINDGSDQDGEGVHMYDSAKTLDTGGTVVLATSLFSSGIGVVSEDMAPYRGKNSIAASTIPIARNYYYSETDDWSLPDEYRFLQSYELTDSYELPSPAVYDETVEEMESLLEREEHYQGYDQSATDAMKQMLLDGKALSVAFSADVYMPGQEEGDPIYLNTEDNKWTHYTYDGGLPNHAVTIVGWDDTIPAEDFLDHSADVYGDGTAHQPEGDGAWIVKNSWGADTEDFPNNNSWGIQNEDGEATGYFYISYYDRSLCYVEAFSFDTSQRDQDSYYIDQYDLMPTTEHAGWVNEHEIAMSSVFTAETDEELRAVSCEVNAADTDVEFEIYLLGEDAKTPDDGELAAVVDASFDYAGYHRVNLEDSVFLEAGQKYAIVVTEQIHYGGQDYYGVSADIADGKEAVDAYNKEMMRENREAGEEFWKANMYPYYSVGVVNPGECYMYVAELSSWEDFSEVITALQETDKYEGKEFDNFPIKAYSDPVHAEDGAAEIEELDYAAPAGNWNSKIIAMELAAAAGILLVIVLVVWLIVRKCRKHRRFKSQFEEQEKEITALKARVAELEGASAESKR